MKLMKMKVLVLGVCALVACAFLSSTAAADEWNKRTTVTFSAPVEVPGAGAQVLPAGTYLFKLLDSPSDRNIVQIFNEDGTHLYTTILAIPNYRLRVSDATVMTFRERAEGQPEAIRAWFYPGANWGQEFVYPKTRATELAKITHEPVLATPIDLSTTPVEALKTAPIEAVTPSGETLDLAKVVEPPPAAAPVELPAAAVKTLPQTASPLPIFGLIGLLSLGTGLGLWMFFKRSSDQRPTASSRAR
jgi:LPXTG-motif cell wall-anchored protein